MAAKRSSMTAPYLLDWRAYHGLTQAQLAEQAHVGISTIRKAENGEPISAISIGKLARFLGMAPRDLRERGPYGAVSSDERGPSGPLRASA